MVGEDKKVSPDLFSNMNEFDVNDLRRLVTRLEKPLKRQQVLVCHELIKGKKTPKECLDGAGYGSKNPQLSLNRMFTNIHFADLYEALCRLYQVQHGVDAGYTRGVLMDIASDKGSKNSDRINAAKELNRMEGHGENRESGGTTIIFKHAVLALGGDTLSIKKRAEDVIEGVVVDESSKDLEYGR